jgi:hypothetical protein
MKLKHLALALALTLGIGGLVHARAVAATPSAERVLALASGRLALSPQQQSRLLPLIRRGVELRARIRAQTEAALRADREELAQPQADLGAMAAEHQALVDANLAQARALRDDLLAFYEHELTPSQQAKARIALSRRIDRLDRIRSGLLALGEDPGV